MICSLHCYVYSLCTERGHSRVLCSVQQEQKWLFFGRVWYVLQQLVLICSSALCKKPEPVTGWMRRNSIICECVLSCCTVLLTVILLLTVFCAAALFWIFSQHNILNKSKVRILNSVAQSNITLMLPFAYRRKVHVLFQ